METRKIMSTKERKIRNLDRAIAFWCIVITEIILIAQNHTTLLMTAANEFSAVKNVNFLLAIVAFIYSIFTNIVSKTFILILIYIPIRISTVEKVKKNMRYKVVDNIEYYRDKFESISPAEMSLILDLEIEIERKKDISATLLSLNIKGLLDFEDDKIKLKNSGNLENLKPSERYLFEALKDGTLDGMDMSNWEKVCIKEAMDDGYIINAKQKRKFFWKSTLLLILAILMLFYSIGKFTKNIDEYSKNVNEVQEEMGTINSNLEKIVGKDDKQLTNEDEIKLKEEYLPIAKDAIGKIGEPLVLGLMIIGSIALIIGLIFYKIARIAIYKSGYGENKYERTKEGKVLAEQIAAMQRYIHEFSLLSDMEKEQVKLWEEFLVYAIVLEENEEIVSNIFSYKNVKMYSFI